MALGRIPLEACLDLQIQLDRLTRAAERCRASLRRVAAGDMSGEEYVRIFREQQAAQSDLERQHEKHFHVPAAPPSFSAPPRPLQSSDA